MYYNYKNEVSTYADVCKKITDALEKKLADRGEVVCSNDGFLGVLLRKNYQALGVEPLQKFIPSLKVDILISISLSGNVKNLLVEVKKGSALKLMDFSQLTGYLQVAREIPTGLLLLVNDGAGADFVSRDFNELIASSQLGTFWRMDFVKNDEFFNFRVGICMYTPGNGVHWVNTKSTNGISSWDDLFESLGLE